MLSNTNDDFVVMKCNILKISYVEDARLGPNQPQTRPVTSTGDERAGICWQIPYVLGHMRTELDSGMMVIYRMIVDVFCFFFAISLHKKCIFDCFGL